MQNWNGILSICSHLCQVGLDLSLNEEMYHGKFGCDWTYDVQMHKEQTNKRLIETILLTYNW